MTTRTAPYGSWKSPIASEAIVSAGLRLGAVAIDDDRLFWLEGRPSEKGRSVLVAREADGTTRDAIPEGFNVRTRAHEYGGGAYTIAGETVYFSHDGDRRLYKTAIGGKPEAITPEGNYRYADLCVDATRDRLLAICEDANSMGEPIASLVAIAGGTATVLAEGETFYASPALSPDGARLAWLTWNHPDMPWNSTTLWVAAFAADGTLTEPVAIAGVGAGLDPESVFQPQWSPDGALYFVSDRSNWWNFYRWDGGSDGDGQKPTAVAEIYPMEAEFATPQWVFGMSTYGFASDGTIVCTYTKDGLWFLATIDPTAEPADRFTPIELPYSDISSVRVSGDRAVFLAGSPTTPGAAVLLDLTTRKTEILQRSTTLDIDPRYLSEPVPIAFPTTDGDTAYGFFYPPTNPDYTAPNGEHPPLLVKSHGGPTAATGSSLSLRIQYWTSRGFAYFDVNYRGSTGYGREYRQLLNGKWGIADVDDAVCGAQNLADRGWVDGDRLAISGGSAGGYTVLSALTFRDTFKAGASYYGISDLEALAKDTHKFEARYLDSLVGDYPAEKDTYVARSPIHFPEKLSCPAIFFQGLEDKVVPPNQAEMMVEALRDKGVPVAYVPFEGEQHGFRQAATIQRALDGEFYFYSRVFGYAPADEIEPVAIENLD
ncbi:MAG: prolyl oligopeptidase family serine peptidase [Geitlerinemataceae cyanobacterium]